MRNWINIVEQTMRTGSRMNITTLRALFGQYSENISKFSIVANLDDRSEFIIMRFDQLPDSIFLITHFDTPVGYYRVKFQNDDVAIFEDAFVEESARGNKLTEKFFWFLKTRERQRVIMGDRQSDDAIAVLKNLNASGRFNIFWTKGDTKIRYDPDQSGPQDGSTDEFGDPTEFYSMIGPTGWHIIVECEQYYKLKPLPHLFEAGLDWIKNSYDLF